MSYGPGQSTAKSDARGLQIFDERLQDAHAIVDQIINSVGMIEARLYAPRPSPVNEIGGSDVIQQSIENGLNALVSRLRKLQSQVDSIVQG